MKGAELIKLLKKSGWRIERTKGSHVVMKKDNKTEVIPLHSKDMPVGLLNAIRKRTGV